MNRKAVPQERQLPMAAVTLDQTLLPEYPHESYALIGLNDLLAYVVYFLEGQKQAVTFENITVASHRMFTAKFSLVGYPQFPDAARVQLVVLHLGPKYVGWLEGKKKIGYYLNARGREAATTTSMRLSAPQDVSTSPATVPQDNLTNRTAVETRLAQLRNSIGFQSFSAGQCSEIADVTLAWETYGLFITADDLTKAETHRQLMEAAKMHDDKDAEEFLGWLARERPHLVGRRGATRHTQIKRRIVRRGRKNDR